jgi:arylsulfatase A-like enzyme
MKQPNILLIVMDAVRPDHLSCYGYPRPTTPNLDQIAANGIIFENCFSTASWTPPSHASLFTGKYASQCGIVGTNITLPRANLTMAKFLRRRGYRTTGTGSAFVSRKFGFDLGFEDFVEHWRRPSLSQLPILKHVVVQKLRLRRGYYDGGDQINREWFKRWAKSVYKRGPFFAFLRFLSAHSPYWPLPSFKRRFEPPLGSADDLEKLRFLAHDGRYSYMAGELAISDREWEILRAWYDACIAFIDHQIGEIVSWLKQHHLFESTLLIITADHGENFGEHGLADHQYCIYDTLLHVPLIVAGPKALVPTGQRIDNLVSLVDVFPTIVELIEPNAPIQTGLAGRSVLPLTRLPIRDRIFAEYGPPFTFRIFERLHPDFSYDRFNKAFKCVRTRDHKYILRSDGVAELYDTRSDPGEMNNIINQFPELAAELRASLSDTLGGFVDTGVESQEVLSIEEEEQLAAHLRDLGYL